MKHKMNAVLVVAMLFLTGTVSKVWAQGVLSRTEIGAGYTYASMDQNAGFVSSGRLNSNGWNTGLTLGLGEWFGLEFNFANVRHSESDSTVVSGIGTVQVSASERHSTFVAGPRLILDRGRARPFAHALAGIDHKSLSASGSSSGDSFSESTSDNSFASLLGGGVELVLSKHCALTGGADYLLTRHKMADLTDFLFTRGTQHNFRVSAGIVFRLGSGFEKH